MRSISVRMLRLHVDAIPQYPLPTGYHMRLFRPGDRETWIGIMRLSEPTVEGDWGATFDHEFGHDLPAMARRGSFLVAPDGRAVGAITAWRLRRYLGLPWGRIHWVAIVPGHRGKGLSRCLMTSAMERLGALGHRRAMLETQTHRIPAIRTYLRFGFLPDMSYGDAARAWRLVRRGVRRGVRHPALRSS